MNKNKELTFSEIIKFMHENKIPLKKSIRLLDTLGYTMQERRRIYNGIKRLQNIEELNNG